MSKEPTFTIINKATDGDYCLAIRGRKVVLALSIPHDPFQQWIRKDAAKKDSEGQPAFILVNKATNEALSYDGTIGPMNLVRYSAGLMDKSVLWTESKNDDQGFRYIRRESFIYWHMTPSSHILHDGSIVELTNGDHISDWWKFVPNSKNQQETTQHTVTISCHKKEGYNLTIRDNTVMLALADPKDRNQIWIKEISYGKQVKDDDNRRAFALVNKATGQAIKHGFGPGYLVQLAPFNRNYLDASLLWTESGSKELGFQEIRMQTNKSVVFHAYYLLERDSNKSLLSLRPRNETSDQHWKFQEIILWCAEDVSTTTLAKPSNQWDPSNAAIPFDRSNDNAKPGGN